NVQVSKGRQTETLPLLAPGEDLPPRRLLLLARENLDACHPERGKGASNRMEAHHLIDVDLRPGDLLALEVYPGLLRADVAARLVRPDEEDGDPLGLHPLDDAHLGLRLRAGRSLGHGRSSRRAGAEQEEEGQGGSKEAPHGRAWR